MNISRKEDQTIRQFLLGQLSEKEQEQVEDRIFADPDFAEEVEIVEHELMAEQRAGNLTEDENERFAAKYASRVNRAALDLERTFNEFVCARTESFRSEPQLSDDPPPERIISPAFPSQRTRVWQRLIPVFGPALVYSTVGVGLLLLVGAIWFLARHYQQTAGVPSRPTIEAELALLNSQAGSPASVLSTVDLEVTQRYGGAMARIMPRNTSPDGVLEFYLNLAEMNNRRYRAVIFDDRRKELFGISGLTAQNSEAGPRIRLFIPIKYLSRGDYQIDLSVANDAGGYDQVNSYAFRLVEPR